MAIRTSVTIRKRSGRARHAKTLQVMVWQPEGVALQGLDKGIRTFDCVATNRVEGSHSILKGTCTHRKGASKILCWHWTMLCVSSSM